MARIDLFQIVKTDTAKNGNKFAVVELMKRNGVFTKRMKAVFFDKDIDLDELAKLKKGDTLGNGEITTIKVADYEINGKTVNTATLFVLDGDEVDAVMAKKRLTRAAAPVAAPATIESLQTTP